MKNITKNQKIISIIIALIIIIGAVVVFTIGFHFDLEYEQTKRIQIFLGEQFEENDIKEMINETMQNKNAIVQKVEVYEDTISIIAKDISEEEKTALLEKVNEKYGTDIKIENIKEQDIPHTRGRDLLKPYILPGIIAAIITLVYMLVRFYKLGLPKVFIKTLLTLAISQVLLFSIIAITRIPLGRLTIPMILVIYVLSLVGITTKFEKELAVKKVEESKNKKKK